MKLLRALFCSSIGKKYIMAITGLLLVLFVIGHLVGNLQVFSHPDKINGYAHFLQSLGPALWIVRLGLLACVGLHIWAAVQLTLENNKAKPVKYAVEVNNEATAASRYMRLSGLVVLAFIAYHLAHFTLGWVGSDTFKTQFAYRMESDFHVLGFTLVRAGQEVHDVHTMVVRGFQSPLVSGFYILAVGLLSFHLVHGVRSLWQSLGLRTRGWDGVLKPGAAAFAAIYFLGNLAIPGAVLAGFVKPQAPSVALTSNDAANR
jgi:succinate dehydrogenase / fumarate reductase cytochrome b subunit